MAILNDYEELLDVNFSIGRCIEGEVGEVLERHMRHLSTEVINSWSVPAGIHQYAYKNGCLSMSGEWHRGKIELKMYLSEMMCRDEVIGFWGEFGSKPMVVINYDKESMVCILQNSGFTRADDLSIDVEDVYVHSTGAYAVLDTSGYDVKCTAYATVERSKLRPLLNPLCNWRVSSILPNGKILMACDVTEDLVYDLRYLFSVFGAGGM